jgi:hypothetical protein
VLLRKVPGDGALTGPLEGTPEGDVHMDVHGVVFVTGSRPWAGSKAAVENPAYL